MRKIFSEIPGNLSRDAGKESLNQLTSAVNISSLDPSVGAQAASAGIQAIKSLIGRKIRQVKITIPASYLIYLKPAKQ